MIDNKRILVVVPARGGSKGIKLKNLVPVCGVPLIAITGKLVQDLTYVDRAIVSTDNEKIADVAKSVGLDVPYYRSEELSGDYISDLQVLTEAIVNMEKNDNIIYDIVLMLQPTSPLRKAAHVTATVQKLVESNYDAVWTVSMTDSKYHPLKQLVVENERLGFYDPHGSEIIARQQLTQLYHRNGAAYAITRSCLLEQASMMGNNPSALIIDDPMISIDTLDDVRLVESIINLEG